MRLRIDPWDPEYGASVEIEPELGPPAGLALDAETDGPWAPIATTPQSELPCCAFIDGVRRIDARLYAEGDEQEAPALAGSWAVGCARSTRPPRIGDIHVGRELVIGGGLQSDPIEMTIGAQQVRYETRSVPGATPLDPIQGLQNAIADQLQCWCRRHWWTRMGARTMRSRGRVRHTARPPGNVAYPERSTKHRPPRLGSDNSPGSIGRQAARDHSRGASAARGAAPAGPATSPTSSGVGAGKRLEYFAIH